MTETTPWPVDNIERHAIDDLVPYAKNSRTHTDEQIEQIARSITEWGWTNPVLIADDGTIIAGHARVMAAKQLGLEQVPVMSAHGWSDEQIKAYIIADNKLAENAGWDMQLLGDEIRSLADFDITLMGFSDGELLTIDSLSSGDPTNNDPNEEWLDMPEYTSENKKAFRSIIVHMKDQECVDAFAKAVGAQLTEKTKMIWYPEIEKESYMDKVYK